MAVTTAALRNYRNIYTFSIFLGQELPIKNSINKPFFQRSVDSGELSGAGESYGRVIMMMTVNGGARPRGDGLLSRKNFLLSLANHINSHKFF